MPSPSASQDPYEDIKALLAVDPVAAVSRLRSRAMEGDANTQLLLGQLLINGVGARCDAQEALRWFQSAASVGVPMAINMVGRCHEYGFGTPVDYAQAAGWYLRAAQLECDWAFYNYAHLLANGRGVDRDRAAALTWFRLAADRGHARAMNFIALYHEQGWETPVDPVAAFDWYRRSAEGGDYRGQCSYASVLAEQGRMDEALHWLREAKLRATPGFLSHLATVLDQSPHEALRSFAHGLRTPPETLPRTDPRSTRSAA